MIKHLSARFLMYKNLKILLLLKGVYYFLRAKIFKVPVLKYMDVAVDYSCNMNCEHCFAQKLKQDESKRLKIEDYRKLAEEGSKLGCMHFNIQGGEPLFLENLLEYIKAFNPKKNMISITTNGFLFDKEKAIMLKDIGIKQIVFSLDSFDAKSHDEFRNRKGAYDLVINGIKIARNMGFIVSINVTVSHESIKTDSQKKLFKWLKEERLPYNPIFAAPIGAWSQKYELMLDKQDIEFINKLRKKNKLVQRDIHASWIKQGCGAVSEQVYITPYGDVMPCPFIQISIGNIHNDSITNIWKNMMKNKIYGRYSNKCWIAENKDFAKKLNEVCAVSDVLPVKHTNNKGKELLSNFWSRRNE